jgi:hypothetical protein
MSPKRNARLQPIANGFEIKQEGDQSSKAALVIDNL